MSALFIEPDRCAYCNSMLVGRHRLTCVGCKDSRFCTFTCLEHHADVTHGRAGIEYRRLSRQDPKTAYLAIAIITLAAAALMLGMLLSPEMF